VSDNINEQKLSREIDEGLERDLRVALGLEDDNPQEETEDQNMEQEAQLRSSRKTALLKRLLKKRRSRRFLIFGRLMVRRSLSTRSGSGVRATSAWTTTPEKPSV